MGAAAATLLLFVSLVVPAIALAHERGTIANGKYDVVVGWDVEPAVESQKNAASIRITRAGTDPAEPVEGTEKMLKVEIRHGAQAREFRLRAVFGQRGYYVADLAPTRPGDYIFTFIGTIEGEPVRAQFASNRVAPIREIQFPVDIGSPGETRVELQNVRTLAYAGIVVGVLGLLAAAAAVTGIRRRIAGRT